MQRTNILRDIREDLDNGQRIYLPMEDLHRFGYSEAELLALPREHFGNQPHRRPLVAPGQERREAGRFPAD